MIAHEYGWTFDEIMGCSFREIQLACWQIARRRHNEFAERAALTGKKIPFRPSPTKPRPELAKTEENQSKDQFVRQHLEQSLKTRHETSNGRN